MLGAILGGLFVLLAVVMPIVTYMIWWLRKLLGWMQSRLGPQHVGWKGLLQTPADALKLLSKEDVIPLLADNLVFTLAPGIVFLAAFLAWVTIPLAPGLVVKDLNIGVVYIAAVTSVTVIGIVLAGWSSNNKYALVSAFRSAGQMVSYEVPLVLALLGPVMLAQSLSLGKIIEAQAQLPFFLGWFWLYQPIVFLCFAAAAMAENNVTPFDIVEAESEIVAGFHVEYSGMKFALFFLAEFANTLLVGIMTAILFFGGWHSPVDSLLRPETWPGPQLGGVSLLHLLWGGAWLMGKTILFISVVFWIRATLPRVRIDQLMDLGWKVLIPITLANLLVVGAAIAFGWPQWVLAALNWGILIGLLLLGKTKPVPQAQRIPKAAVAAPAEATTQR
ncbi:MAG: NADH-quinone oxidoreductase subunit NuoH [Armatimonadetes bacterium]|nr:NADH-quinone oxidoreductase subunit NuoH [Armatimonadota bacterium]